MTYDSFDDIYVPNSGSLRRSASSAVIPAPVSISMLKRCDLQKRLDLASAPIPTSYKPLNLRVYGGQQDWGALDNDWYNRFYYKKPYHPHAMPYSYLASQQYYEWPYKYWYQCGPRPYTQMVYTPESWKFGPEIDSYRPWWSYLSYHRYPSHWDIDPNPVSRVFDLYTKGLLPRTSLLPKAVPSYGGRKYSPLYEYVEGLHRYRYR